MRKYFSVFLLVFILSIFQFFMIPDCIAQPYTPTPTGFQSKECKPEFTSVNFPTWPQSGANFVKYIEFFMGIFEWLHETNLLMCIIIPIVGVFVISYGFLETLRIFQSQWVNVVLSILMALAFTNLGPLNWIVGFLFKGMGGYGVLIFALMFVVGAWLLYRRRQAEWGTRAGIASAFREETRTLRHQLRTKRSEYTRLVHALGRADLLARPGIRKRLNQLNDEIEEISDRLTDLKEAHKT